MSYAIVLQPAIAGVLRADKRWITLAGVNAVVMLIFLLFSKGKQQKADPKMQMPFVREKSRHQSETPDEQEQKPQATLSESNIEQIKIKINKSKPRAQKSGVGILRFVIFLLALLGFAGIGLMLWDTFDFLGLIFAAFAMCIFLLVVFKGFNLWAGNLFKSLYLRIFLALGVFGLWGLLANDDNAFKAQVHTWIAQQLGQTIEAPVQKQEIDSFTGYESTGEVLNVSFSGEELAQEQGLVALSGELLATGTTETTLASSGEQVQTGTLTTPVAQPEPKPVETEVQPVEKADSKTPLTMLDAIKHLVAEYQLPLSTSKTVKFTHVAFASADYPYMKTALEKKMIGSTTNPKDQISCDVYMVMKGLAQNWTDPKTANIRAVSWQIAKSKNQLNGCQQGAKLTAATL